MLQNTKNLSKYRILNCRINESIREFYLVNRAFLFVNSGLLATNFFISDKAIISSLGIIFSILWFLSLIIHYYYINQWIERAKKLEGKEGIWKNAPNVFPNLMTLFMLLPIVFFGLWFWLLLVT